jgi:hypothetical protein
MSASPVLQADWPYQNRETVLLLYSQKHTDVFPETFLVSLYFRLKEDGLLDIIFPGMEMNHLNQFVSYMSKVQGFCVCCLKNPDGAPKPVGLGWITEVQGPMWQRRGAFGFGFYKEVWGRWAHADLSMMMLRYWFEEMGFAVLYGTTLNPVAKNYSKRFGFKQIGILPKFFVRNGMMTDGHLISLEKPEFHRYYCQWLAKRGY